VVTEFLPDVGWAGAENTISCPFGHHVREGRWIRNPEYLDSYIGFMVEKGSINGERAYLCWPAWSALERAKVTGDFGLLEKNLTGFVRNYESWEKGWTIKGLSLQDVKDASDYNGPQVKSGFRAERGLFDFVGLKEGTEFALSADGARPMVNSAMWAEATAIAEIARRAGQMDLQSRFVRLAADLEKNIKERLWNKDKRFFTALSVGGKLDDVCELHGYAPFYFGMDMKGYESAWMPLMDEHGFKAPKGLTYPARNTPGFDLSEDLKHHECLWNGPSWPYATSIALTALYEALQRGDKLSVDAEDFAALVHQYAAQQVLTRPDGRIVPWIDENLDPMTGEWLARRHMIEWDRHGVRKLQYRERGKDYNHSTFCDLVIAGLCGFVPKADGTFEVKPLAPKAWDWWCVDGIRYRNHDITVLFDRDGSRYGRGVGLVVLKDGEPLNLDDGKYLQIFNEDDSCFFISYWKNHKPGDAVTTKELEAYVDELSASGKLTHFFMSPNAMRANFPSKVFEPAWAPCDVSGWKQSCWSKALKLFFDNGIDPYAVWAKRCRERGVSPWFSVRMNDLHEVFRPTYGGHSKFWREHPQFWREPFNRDERDRDLRALDYSHPEVREYMQAFVRELLERYDVDGVECDWMRFMHHLTPGHEREQSACLDSVMRDVRRSADAAAKRLGHPVRVGVRVDSDPKAALGHGTDPFAWAAQGSVDLVVPCNFYFSADFDLPLGEWTSRLAAANPRVRVIPGTDNGLVEEGKQRRVLTLDEYCGWADRMNARGGKGVYLFNFMLYPRDGEVWKFFIANGFGPEAIADHAKSVPKSYVRECDHPMQ